jgi:hypothetical protein
MIQNAAPCKLIYDYFSVILAEEKLIYDYVNVILAAGQLL